MTKKIAQVALLLGGFFVPTVVAAQYGAEETAKVLGYNSDQTVYSMAAAVVSVILSLTAIVFFGFMMYAGLRWMTARGNEEFAEKAKHTLEASAIGFIIVVLSYALTRFVFKGLGI